MGMENSVHEDILRRIMGEVTEKLTLDLRDVLATTLAQTLEQQISSALTQSLLESEVYRRISADMRNGLQRIYKEISATTKVEKNDSSVEDVQAADKEKADKLFHEASSQLSAVLTQTEQATVAILEVVERHLDLQAESEDLFKKVLSYKASKHDLERLAEINAQLGMDLNTIMLSLSFQDLTGQRIKRAVAALKEIESTVVDLYLSSGLLIQAYEESPNKPLEQIEAEAKKKVSVFKGGSVLEDELKGPSDSSQKEIDDLLSQLGM